MSSPESFRGWSGVQLSPLARPSAKPRSWAGGSSMREQARYLPGSKPARQVDLQRLVSLCGQHGRRYGAALHLLCERTRRLTMNERSFIVPTPMSTNARKPLMIAADKFSMPRWFALPKRGFHQTSMHDISAEAGISVGLIYRYFKNKDEVISAMADGSQEVDSQICSSEPGRRPLCSSRSKSCSLPIVARTRPRSFPLSWSIFSPKPAAIHGWRSWCVMWCERQSKGVTDLIARSPDSKHTAHGLEPQEIAEMIFAINRRNDDAQRVADVGHVLGEAARTSTKCSAHTLAAAV